MGRYNLLDEPWISVIIDKKGNSKNVSMIDFFKHAHEYLDMGGDTKTQDFAVMRVMIAVIHTVFSRVDASGEPYEYFDIDERFRQKELVDEYDVDDYEGDLIGTWIDIWKMKEFPDVVIEYLEAWRDRFYLFDDKYPFFQVTKEDIEQADSDKENPGEFFGKNINRKISQSGNKTSLFSPKYEKENNRDILDEDEIARWLLTLQGYVGQSDKVRFKVKKEYLIEEKYKAANGWLYDLGGIYIRGQNIFETIMLNCVLANKNQNNLMNRQTPCWELENRALLKKYLNSAGDIYDNEVSLLTAWSRAVFIDPDTDAKKPFVCSIVKLPDVDHRNKIIEQMTIWNYNEKGKYKNTFTPRKHQSNKSIWRSFGLISGNVESGEDKKYLKPGVIEWLNDISSVMSTDIFIDNMLNICSVSMKDNGHQASMVPVDEIVDDLFISEKVFLDKEWVVRINETIEKTKTIVRSAFSEFIEDIREIRNINDRDFTYKKIEELYYSIDFIFRDWLLGLKLDDEKEEKIFEWNRILRKIVIDEANKVVKNANNRDFKGKKVDDGMKNIATAYNYFIYSLNHKIKIKKEAAHEEK